MYEAINVRNQVHVSFNPNSREAYLLIFKNEDAAREFVTVSSKVLDEVENKGHHNTAENVTLFADKNKKVIGFKYGKSEFNFNLTTEDDTEDFSRKFAKEIWGDLAI